MQLLTASNANKWGLGGGGGLTTVYVNPYVLRVESGYEHLFFSLKL